MEAVNEIVSRSWDSFTQHPTYTINLEEHVGSLRKEIKKLIEKRNDVKRTVKVDEVKGLTPRDEVTGWLERVEATKVEAYKIEADFDRRRRTRFWKYFCWFNYQLGKRVVKMVADVVELKDEGGFSHVADESPPDPVTEMPSTPTVGMDLTMQKVLDHLKEDEVNPYKKG